MSNVGDDLRVTLCQCPLHAISRCIDHCLLLMLARVTLDIDIALAYL